jgi:serine-type D-Ala-D-Ala carboxypeptidase (penicillin-binding protein 5/6)
LLPYRLIWAFKFLVIAILLLVLLPAPPALANFSWEAGGCATAFVIPRAEAAVLIEAKSGTVLYESAADLALPPASTTKILTALLALDMGVDLNKLHLVSAKAAAVGDSSLHLRAGESLTLDDLLKGALVHSGNDACYAIGEIIAGSEPLFVHWMNMKAAVLGAFSVHMDNTNGLPSTTHQMSAEDLALLCRYAMANDFFAATVASKYIALGSGASARSYQNTNKLLWQNPHIVGIKTGTTDAAGPCLAAAYQDGAALYISVVLHSPDRYGECFSLLKHAAAKYMLFYLPCRGEVLAYYPGAGGVRLIAARDLTVLIQEEAAVGLRLVWHLAPQGGSLVLVNGEGLELGKIDLLVAAD